MRHLSIVVILFVGFNELIEYSEGQFHVELGHEGVFIILLVHSIE